MSQNQTPQIKVYGADWCGHTLQTRNYLDQEGIAYHYINVEENQAASQWVKDHNDGMEIKPTLDIKGEIVTNPAPTVLARLLEQHGISA